jgi:heme exporter protein B
MTHFMLILMRDLRIAWRSGGSWVMGAVFMMTFLALCAIALGGQLSELRRLGVAFIWLGVFFSMLLSFATIFQTDYRQGTLAQILLSGPSALTVCLAKWVGFLATGFLPLFLITPLTGSFFGLSGEAIGATMLTLAIAAPALGAYVTLAGAVLCARNGAGFLAVLLVMPFLVPLLIFGLDATDSFLNIGWAAVEIRILAGLSLLSIAIGLPASAAALRINLETT